MISFFILEFFDPCGCQTRILTAVPPLFRHILVAGQAAPQFSGGWRLLNQKDAELKRAPSLNEK
jgi:hypothetical protein